MRGFDFESVLTSSMGNLSKILESKRCFQRKAAYRKRSRFSRFNHCPNNPFIGSALAAQSHRFSKKKPHKITLSPPEDMFHLSVFSRGGAPPPPINDWSF